jgi:phage-related protein
MAFYAKNFIFNGKPSEFYGLYLGEFNGSGESMTAASSDVSLLTQKLFRKPVPLFWGAEQTPILSFNLSMYSEFEIHTPDFSNIATWLFGQMNYKVLRVCQNDMIDTYFNCFLTAPQIVREGNMIRGLSATVLCDAPWGWREGKEYDYNWGDNTYQIDDTIILNNENSNNFYTYPTSLKIYANIFGGSVTITNTTDNNRAFILNLLPEEVVTLDCDHQFISSTLVQYPLINFNKNWLRFLQGTNNLTISGNISEIKISSPVAVKIS